MADRHGRNADLNRKLKISNTTDIADITQSEARDTRHRRMQKVSSLITDLFEPNNVLWVFHAMQLFSECIFSPISGSQVVPEVKLRRTKILT